MGRGQKWQAGWDEWPSSPRTWQLWHGARKPAGGWKGDGKQKGAKANAFPAYDSKRGQGQAKDSLEPADMSTDPGSLTQILQSSLNNTRKTEQRVLSLNKALLEREELWKKYEADMRQAYRREYGRFHRDMERLRDDLQKANAAQAGARVAEGLQPRPAVGGRHGGRGPSLRPDDGGLDGGDRWSGRQICSAT